MILGNNHISLGAYLEQIGGRSGGSTSSRSVTPTPSRTITQAKESDPWGHFIVPFASGRYGIVFTDGVQNWNVVMNNTDSVEDAVKWFLSKYYKYSLLPRQNENGTYDNAASTPRGGGSYRGMSGLFDNFKSAAKAASSVFDSNNDDFNAEYDFDNYRVNTDQADYNLAMSQGLLLTLSEVLLSFNLAGKFFLLPYGYYYIGDAVKTGAYYNLDAAKETAEQSGRGRYLLQQEEFEEFVDGKSEDEPGGKTEVKPKMSTKQKLLYALMALGTILYFTIDGDTKKKRKR